MVRRKQYSEGFKLTMKKARQLAIQEFGTAKGLEKEDNAPSGYFEMRLGNLYILIHPDTRGSGCIEIEFSSNGYGCHCIQYHDPDTLKGNFEVEERYRRKNEQESMKDWVKTHGPEFCHMQVDKFWNEET